MARRPTTLSTLLATLVLAASGSAIACPFCGWLGTRPPPVQETLRESRAAVVAKLVDPIPDDVEVLRGIEKEEGWIAHFEIERVLLGQGAPRTGVVVKQEVHGLIPEPEAVYLLTRGTEGEDAVRWRVRRLMSGGARLLVPILALPVASEKDPAPRRERLRFFLPHLSHADPVIAEAAYFEFTQAKYPDLVAIRNAIDPDVIALWLEDPKLLTNRGLLHLLLGLSARETHRKKMKAWLARPEWEWSGLDGLIGAYLLVGGEEALGEVRRQLAADGSRARARHFARSFITALRFHDEEEDVLPKPQIREAILEMLENPRVADLAVRELERRKDWDALDVIALLVRDHGDANPRIAAVVRLYLRTCPRPEAKTLLAKLEAGRVAPR